MSGDFHVPLVVPLVPKLQLGNPVEGEQPCQEAATASNAPRAHTS